MLLFRCRALLAISTFDTMLRTFLLSLFVCFRLSANAFQTSADWQWLDTTVARALDTFGTTGLAIAVVQDGQVVFSKGYGQADAEAGTPLTTRHLFNIASCSKAFTAAAVALLVEEGKLGWDDKVTDWLPEFRLSDDWITRQLEVRDLLCHRSGLATFMGDLLWYHSRYSDEEVMRRMRFLPIERDFRSEYGYQNNMYMVAGLIIEKASGMPWERFVRERLLLPLDMTHTRTSNDSLKGYDPLAWPHIDGQRIEPHDFNATKPAASLFASVDDLTHWVQMWLDEGRYAGRSILPKGSIQELLQPQTIMRVNGFERALGTHFKAYALGWRLFDYGGKMVVEHDGGMPGYISKITLVPEAGLGIIILNNGMDFFVNSALRYEILQRALGTAEPRDFIGRYARFRKNYLQRKAEQEARRLAARVEGTQPSLPPDAWTGYYEDRWYGRAIVGQKKDGSLVLTFEPASEVFTGPLTHWHYDTWRVDFRDPFLTFGLVTFEMDAYGRPTGFTIDLPSDDFHFDKLHFRKVDGE